MKSKGMTLIELIISMALISVVLIFLFRLLVDVRYNDEARNYDLANQQKRAIIVNRVQKDFIEKGLVKLTDRSSSSNILLDFGFSTGESATLGFYKDSTGYYVDYKDSNNAEEKWYIETENEKTSLALNCVKYSFVTENNGDYFLVKFNIPVVAKANSINIIDDFEFSYIGLKSVINVNNFPNKASLGTYNANTCG